MEQHRRQQLQREGEFIDERAEVSHAVHFVMGAFIDEQEGSDGDDLKCEAEVDVLVAESAVLQLGQFIADHVLVADNGEQSGRGNGHLLSTLLCWHGEGGPRHEE